MTLSSANEQCVMGDPFVFFWACAALIRRGDLGRTLLPRWALISAFQSACITIQLQLLLFAFIRGRTWCVIIQYKTVILVQQPIKHSECSEKFTRIYKTGGLINWAIAYGIPATSLCLSQCCDRHKFEVEYNRRKNEFKIFASPAYTWKKWDITFFLLLK